MESLSLLENKKTLISIAAILVLVTFLTHYYGSTDIGDYADVAKYFTGEYAANIRSSHSYLFGLLHTPFVDLTNSFLIFKISSLVFLFLIIVSVYKISGYNKKTLVLMLLSPIVWYMAPWINPLQLASLFLLWAYYHLDKYKDSSQLFNLISAGILIGLAWSVWNTILFLGALLALSFLYNKRAWELAIFAIAIGLGLVPLLVLDTFLFHFPFQTLLKTTVSNVFVTLAGGIYGSSSIALVDRLIRYALFFLVIPPYFWKLYKPGMFKKHPEALVFLTLSLVLFLPNPQTRYLISVVPIMILLLGKYMTPLQVKRQTIYSVVIILLVSLPYMLQIPYSINGEMYGVDTYVLASTLPIHLSNSFPDKLVQEDLNTIASELPNQKFLVGNAEDAYQTLAHFYWGDAVDEFVSIQDYELFKQNKTVLFSKHLQSSSTIRERRTLWLEGGLSANPSLFKDYDTIEYALTFEDESPYEGYTKVKKYQLLTLWKKD